MENLKTNHEFVLQVVEITTSKELFDEYFLRIPVLRVDGKDLIEAEDIGSPEQYKSKLTKLVENLS